MASRTAFRALQQTQILARRTISTSNRLSNVASTVPGKHLATDDVNSSTPPVLLKNPTTSTSAQPRRSAKSGNARPSSSAPQRREGNSVKVVKYSLHDLKGAHSILSSIINRIPEYNPTTDTHPISSILALYQSMHRQGIEPTKESYLLLLNACIEVLRVQGAVTTVMAANSRGIPKNEAETEWHVIWGIYSDAESKGISLGREGLDYLLEATSFCNNKVYSDNIARLVLPRNKLPFTAKTYHFMIKRYIAAETQNEDMAVLMFNEMMGRGIVPSALLMNDLVQYLCERRLPRLATDVVAAWDARREKGEKRLSAATMLEMLHASVVDHYAKGVETTWKMLSPTEKLNLTEGLSTAILNVTGRYGLPELASEVLVGLSNQSIPLTEIHLAPLLEAFTASGRLSEAFNVLAIMRSHNLKPTWETSQPIFKSISGSVEDADKAFFVIEKMHREGKIVDVEAANAVIQACVANGDLARAVGTYKEYKNLGVTPNAETFNLQLVGCIDAAHKQLGEELLDDMKALKIVPDERTYERLVLLSLTQTDYEDAFHYLEEMKSQGFKPTVVIFEALLRTCHEKLDVRKKAIIQEMRENELHLSKELRSILQVDDYSEFLTGLGLEQAAGLMDLYEGTATGAALPSMLAENIGTLAVVPFLEANTRTPAVFLSITPTASSASAIGFQVLWSNQAYQKLVQKYEPLDEVSRARLETLIRDVQLEKDGSEGSSFIMNDDFEDDTAEHPDLIYFTSRSSKREQAFEAVCVHTPAYPNILVLYFRPLPSRYSTSANPLHSRRSFSDASRMLETPRGPVADQLNDEGSGAINPTSALMSEKMSEGGNLAAQDEAPFITPQELLETTDWSQTALGPRENWPPSLKTALSITMALPHESTLWWGPELNLIYNLAYAKMSLNKHPRLFGQPAAVGWKEIWGVLKPIAEQIVATGVGVEKVDDIQFFERGDKGYTEETYCSWTWVPVIVEDGTVGGLFNHSVETTARVLAERRLASVNDLSKRTMGLKTVPELSSAILQSLISNVRDAPFAFIYESSSFPLHKTQTSFHQPPSAQNVQFQLLGQIGIPVGHPSIPQDLNLVYNPNDLPNQSLFSSPLSSPMMSSSSIPATNWNRPSASSPWPLLAALAAKRSLMVHECAGLTQGFENRSWELPTSALVMPIFDNDSPSATRSLVLVVGLNTRRPFDSDYSEWLEMFRLHCCSAITSVENLEFQVKKAQELQTLDKAKTSFFSSASHELRTPLTLIRGPIIDLESSEKDGSPKKKILSIALRNVNRLGRLIDSLMDYSRIEAGRLTGSFSFVKIGSYTADLSSLFRSAIEKGGVRYVVNCEADDDRGLFVDPDLWEKIVFNLVGNAFKYTLEGAISVSLRYSEREVVFAVQDSGVGIPASDIAKVTDRFHRVQNSLSRSAEGTGIGLSLAVELIKLHGGSLTIQSETAEESPTGSHGSVFAVTIPTGYSHLPREKVDLGEYNQIEKKSSYTRGIISEISHWQTTENSESSQSDSGSGSDGKLDPSTLFWSKSDTLLIIDDNSDMRSYLRALFSPYVTIIEAQDGLEGLDQVVAHSPNLILCDLMMPRLDGHGFLSALRGKIDFSLIPVIFLSARGGETDKVDGLMLGAEDYILKPFNPKELIARSHLAMISGKRLIQRTAEIKLLSDHSPISLFRAAASGSVEYVNNAWLEHSGHPADLALDDWVQNIVEEDIAQLEKCWVSAMEGHDGECEFRFKATGKWAALQLRYLGPNQGVIGTFVDISDRKQLDAERQAAFATTHRRMVEAEEQKRQQELLIDVTSHEIRNPISGIIQCSSLINGNLSFLRAELNRGEPIYPNPELLNLLEEDMEACESIYQCAASQERIANDILSLARIQLDTLSIIETDVDVIQEANTTISTFSNEARMKQIHLSLELGPSITAASSMGNVILTTDVTRVRQVFTNLLTNAIRFTEGTKGEKSVTVGLDVSNEPPQPGTCAPLNINSTARIDAELPIFLYGSITDTGPGLKAEELSILFRRFSQASPESHKVFGGSGLGLYVCRRLCELMNGRIEVLSQEGKGSTFRFFVQVKVPKQIPLDVTMQELNAEPTTLVSLNVLVVEDNMINQKVLKRQLLKAGLTCDVADDGQQGLIKLEESFQNKTPYSVVLMDLEMPVMGGIQAIKTIRERERNGQYPYRSLVFALTGNARQAQIDAAIAAGMDEVVIKPYKIDDLLAKMRRSQRIVVNQLDTYSL